MGATLEGRFRDGRLLASHAQDVSRRFRDPRRMDDVDSRGPDHAADAARYALGAERPRFEQYRLEGYF